MLDLRDFVNMLQGNLSYKLFPWSARSLQLSLTNRSRGGVQKHVRGVWGAQLEVEGAVWADGDAGRDWDAGCYVGGARVELLHSE